jgi:hypothetical protein
MQDLENNLVLKTLLKHIKKSVKIGKREEATLLINVHSKKETGRKR